MAANKYRALADNLLIGILFGTFFGFLVFATKDAATTKFLLEHHLVEYLRIFAIVLVTFSIACVLIIIPKKVQKAHELKQEAEDRRILKQKSEEKCEPEQKTGEKRIWHTRTIYKGELTYEEYQEIVNDISETPLHYIKEYEEMRRREKEAGEYTWEHYRRFRERKELEQHVRQQEESQKTRARQQVEEEKRRQRQREEEKKERERQREEEEKRLREEKMRRDEERRELERQRAKELRLLNKFPFPEWCPQCGEKMWERIDVSPTEKSCRYQCNYCAKIVTVRIFPQSLNGREPIPQAVRHEVWQRDRGCCVKCGNQEKLEYDHIIPVSRGGANTARNIQLLCETCNRQKGNNI